MKTIIGYLYIAALLSGLAGLWFSIVPTIAHFIDRIDGDFTHRALETFIYKEGILLLLSLGVLMLTHIGTSLTDVFDESTETENEKEELNNLSGTPWDPKRNEKSDS